MAVISVHGLNQSLMTHLLILASTSYYAHYQCVSHSSQVGKLKHVHRTTIIYYKHEREIYKLALAICVNGRNIAVTFTSLKAGTP